MRILVGGVAVFDARASVPIKWSSPPEQALSLDTAACV